MAEKDDIDAKYVNLYTILEQKWGLLPREFSIFEGEHGELIDQDTFIAKFETLYDQWKRKKDNFASSDHNLQTFLNNSWGKEGQSPSMPSIPVADTIWSRINGLTPEGHTKEDITDKYVETQLPLLKNHDLLETHQTQTKIYERVFEALFDPDDTKIQELGEINLLAEEEKISREKAKRARERLERARAHEQRVTEQIAQRRREMDRIKAQGASLAEVGEQLSLFDREHQRQLSEVVQTCTRVLRMNDVQHPLSSGGRQRYCRASMDRVFQMLGMGVSAGGGNHAEQLVAACKDKPFLRSVVLDKLRPPIGTLLFLESSLGETHDSNEYILQRRTRIVEQFLEAIQRTDNTTMPELSATRLITQVTVLEIVKSCLNFVSSVREQIEQVRRRITEQQS